MREKPKKTERELQELIMKEVRKHPELRNVQGVAITRPVQLAPHLSNWGFAWTMDGRAPSPLAADAIAQNLQMEYDLH